MAKVKVVGGNNLDQNLNGDAFTNTASQTIFQFGRFNVTSNYSGRQFIDYSQVLSTFVKPITLETLTLNEVESEAVLDSTVNAVLNLDKSDLNTFTKFGSAYEFLRVSVENIISKYPGSLYVNSQISNGKNVTFVDFNFDELLNQSTFKIPTEFIDDKFGLVFDQGNSSLPDDNELKNLNISYNKYAVWSTYLPDNNTFVVLGFTGDSSSRNYLMVRCLGNPFPFISGDTFGRFDIHLRPNIRQFDNFRAELSDFEVNMVSQRDGTTGFKFDMKEPFLIDDGTINYNDKVLVWTTTDGYNVDTDNARYRTFLEVLLTIGNKYDRIKTDLIARFLTPASIKTYDLTEEGKISKLLRIYGREFDQLKQFINSLVNINKVTYNKKNNLPDQIVKNLARTFGWDYFQLVNEEELVDRLLTFDESERNLVTDPLPAEVDIELWRRILINTNYFWKSKGTREAIKSMFLLIGIPEPFINITEYVYTTNGRIDPRDVTLTVNDLPSTTLPYNNLGYPIAPEETPDFYFQMSGDTDSGQAYLDVFRDVGFTLNQIVDNKKSWVYSSGATNRTHYTTRDYNIQSSELVINTKEVDVALDTARGIEYDVYRYIEQVDFPANSSGYTVPFNFVNLSLNVASPDQGTFTLPFDPEGDIEVRFNGIQLVGPQYYDYNTDVTTSGNTYVDYYFPNPSTDPRTFKLGSAVFGDYVARNDSNRRDVIEATFIYKTDTGISKFTVKYIVVRVNPNPTGTIIPLPEEPYGDVQLTINGVALTKSTNIVQGDYIINPNNSEELIIQNPELITYFQYASNLYTQVAFISVTGTSSIEARNETTRVDSFCSGKIYFNNAANKFVYRLNYRIVNPTSVKVLLDGIALEPGTDYTVNPNNPYEIFLPPGINLGSVISTYYVVGGDDVFDPIIGPLFGLGDVTQMSFLEFIEVIQKKLINATNRKVITDHKGGWYPTLYKVYTTYLQRGDLDPDNPLHTNGYTFQNLYPFLSKYNAFFKRFVDQLLSATIILRKGGLLVRNTVFTKQKHTYKRGVSFDNGLGIVPGLNYYGDDGSVFLKRPLQQISGWKEDFVCIDDLCDEFDVRDVYVTYPGITTTTTTAMPYSAIMRIIEESYSIDIITPDENVESTLVLSLAFEDPIPPGYQVSVDLNFLITLYNGGSGIYEFALGQVLVQKNGGSVLNVTEVNSSGTGTDTYTPSTTVVMDAGDTVQITIYNLVQGAANPIAQSTVRVTPAINSVSPNGIINLITPSYEENYIEIHP